MTKKTSTKKPSKTVYVVTTHEQMDDCSYEGSTANVVGVFTSREAAEKVAYGEATEYLEQLYCERAYIGGVEEEYNWGDWDDLPETEEDRDKDEETYSQEKILADLRKGGGRLDLYDAEGNFVKIDIDECKLRDK